MLLRLLLVLVLSTAPLLLHAQVSEGVVTQRNWPLSTLDGPVPARHWARYDAMPFLDSLTLGYRFEAAGAAPSLEAAVRWTMGREGVLRGRRVPSSRLPDGLRLVAFELRADVMQNGVRASGFTLRVDSTRLGPGEVLSLSPQATWDVLFDDLDAEQARRLVGEGFTLENLRLARAAFAVIGATRTSAAPGQMRRDELDYRTIYVIDAVADVTWHLAWLFADAPAPRSRAVSGKARGEGGRGGRTGDRDRDDKKKDDDEDDEGELLPVALTAVAGAAVLAYAGGTIGYYATPHEPFGLAAGVVRRRGGVLLQASVNAQALGIEDGSERMSGRVTVFGDVFRAPFQPALSLGARVQEEGVFHADPVLSLGAALNLYRVVLLGGVDVMSGTPEFGFVLNFRAR